MQYRIKTEFVDPICSCVELARKCDYMTFLKKVTWDRIWSSVRKNHSIFPQSLPFLGQNNFHKKFMIEDLVSYNPFGAFRRIIYLFGFYWCITHDIWLGPIKMGLYFYLKKVKNCSLNKNKNRLLIIKQKQLGLTIKIKKT